MIKISLPIVVEGRHDKAFLSSFLDALIITTDGFGIFSSTQKVEFIRSIAGQRGIIILTDSDNAGMLIRGRLKSMLPNIDIINVYTPEIKGKERRKSAPSKQGLLGVEGMRPEAVLNALCKAGVLTEKNGVYFEAHNAKNGCGGPADCLVGRQSKNAGGRKGYVRCLPIVFIKQTIKRKFLSPVHNFYIGLSVYFFNRRNVAFSKKARRTVKQKAGG